MTRSPSDITVAPADRDQQARDLVRALHLLGVAIWLDAAGLNARPMSLLSQELRDEIEEVKPELIELLKTEGIEDIFTLDADAVVTNSTPPAPELSTADKLATSLKASRRSYQGGQVVVNGQNAMGRYMRLLREQREASQAAERGELPPAGRYRTNFDVFNRKEYE